MPEGTTSHTSLLTFKYITMYGIENLKKLIKFGCDLTKQISTSLADGWSWIDAFGFVDEVAAIPGVVKSFPAIQLELSELSTEERQELYDYLVEEFDIPNDRVEVVLENSIALAIAAVALVEQWKALKNPPPPIQ